MPSAFVLQWWHVLILTACVFVLYAEALFLIMTIRRP